MTALLNFAILGTVLGPAMREPLFDTQRILFVQNVSNSRNFGSSVSISTDTAVVSGQYVPRPSPYSTASAHIFQRHWGGLNNWGEVATLDIPGPIQLTSGELSVCISGDTVVVVNFPGGSTFVFERNRGGPNAWGLVKELTGAHGGVAIDGDTLIVGVGNRVDVFERNLGGNDNWGPSASLQPADDPGSVAFGNSLAIDGDTIIVGAVGDHTFGTESGAVYIFERDPETSNNWGQTAKLFASDAATGDLFGIAVSIDGGTAVVGARTKSLADLGAGAAYVFERHTEGSPAWSEVATLAPSDLTRYDYFGGAVSVDGDQILVGAVGNGGAVSDSGAVYHFQRDFGGPDQWGEIAKFTSDESNSGDYFGYVLDQDNGVAIVGAVAKELDSFHRGTAYVFSTSECGDAFVEGAEECDDAGYSPTCDSDCTFAICGDSVANSAAGEECDGADHAACQGVPCRRNCTCAPATCGNGIREPGEACDRNDNGLCGGGLTCRSDCTCALPKARLPIGADDREPGQSDEIAPVFDVESKVTVDEDGLGPSVSISGPLAIVGAPASSFGCPGDPACRPGSAYIYTRQEGDSARWTRSARLEASDGAVSDLFGSSVSISGTCAVVGARHPGAAYVYCQDEIEMDHWAEVAKLQASDGSNGDDFGQTVAISADTVLVGAFRHDGLFRNSGAAYVFERNGGGEDGWRELRKLEPMDAAQDDGFGYSVTIDGDTAVVGAIGDDDRRDFSGSAYVFRRNKGGPGNWGQVAKLIGAEVRAGSWFGYSVSIEGNTIVVGAPFADDNEDLSGSAFVFSRDDNFPDKWTEITRLIPENARARALFGWSTSISENIIVVGAPWNLNVNNSALSGSVFVFQRDLIPSRHWVESYTLNSTDAAADDLFGLSVAIDGNALLVGAPDKNDPDSTSGAAYFYRDSQCGDGIAEGYEQCDGSDNALCATGRCLPDCSCEGQRLSAPVNQVRIREAKPAGTPKRDSR